MSVSNTLHLYTLRLRNQKPSASLPQPNNSKQNSHWHTRPRRSGSKTAVKTS